MISLCAPSQDLHALFHLSGKEQNWYRGHYMSVKYSIPEDGRSVSQGMIRVTKANVQVAVASFPI